MKKIGAVLNEGSGILSPAEKKERLDKIRTLLADRVDPENLAIVPGEKVFDEMKRILNNGVDLFIAGGGDGTISAAASLLAGKDTPLLVLALGTKNNFAGDLGVPEDPEKAIALLNQPNFRKIDLGNVNGRYFINNATLGVYPDLVRHREVRTDKHGWSKWRAKIVAALVVMNKIPYKRLTIEYDGKTKKLLTPFLFVGNNEYSDSIEAGFTRTSLNGGKIWLCLSSSPRIWSLYSTALQITTRGVANTDTLETKLLDELTVIPRRKKVRVAIDGENVLLSSPLRFKTERNSLNVITP